jgi:hypothetical protein
VPNSKPPYPVGCIYSTGAALRSYRVLVDEAAEPVASADRSR